MDHFRYRDRVLHCEDVPVVELATRYDTPLYVYSQAAILTQLTELQQAFAAADPLICFSIKSNPNIHLAKLMAERGAGFDVTSGGELYRALAAGGTGDKIVFAGVAKTDEELKYGLEAKVRMFNVESEAELHRLADVAYATKKTANVALRVNPNLPLKTHPKTDTSVKGTKFGLDIETVLEVAAGVRNRPGVKIAGVHMHLGSPIYSAQPYADGAGKAVSIVAELRKQGHPIESMNMGGGFGIDYRKRESLPTSAFADAISPFVREANCQLILEPGRFIVGNAGILLSRVIYTKDSGGRHFLCQDAGMNDLIRPTLYDAFHRIWPVTPAANVMEWPDDFESEIAGTQPTDVVGPVCETGDFLAKDRWLPAMNAGDLLATFSAGAYGMAMSSNYNSRRRAAEVLVIGSSHRMIRRRETYEDLVRCEREVTGV